MGGGGWMPGQSGPPAEQPPASCPHPAHIFLSASYDIHSLRMISVRHLCSQLPLARRRPAEHQKPQVAAEQPKQAAALQTLEMKS